MLKRTDTVWRGKSRDIDVQLAGFGRGAVYLRCLHDVRVVND